MGGQLGRLWQGYHQWAISRRTIFMRWSWPWRILFLFFFPVWLPLLLLGLVIATVPLLMVFGLAQVIEFLWPRPRVVRRMAIMVQQDKFGKLWEFTLPGYNRFRAVEVEDKTLNFEGHRNHYMIGVPFAMRTAEEAVAWTFRLAPGKYQPAVET